VEAAPCIGVFSAGFFALVVAATGRPGEDPDTGVFGRLSATGTIGPDACDRAANRISTKQDGHSIKAGRSSSLTDIRLPQSGQAMTFACDGAAPDSDFSAGFTLDVAGMTDRA
jgi:hypothetical protein